MLNPELPLLPLVLHNPHPGLVMALGQEGVPFVVWTERNHRCSGLGDSQTFSQPLGRFLLYDSRRDRGSQISGLTAQHQPIDLADVCRDLDPDPLDGLIDEASTLTQWRIGDAVLRERVSRHSKADLRRQFLDRLRHRIESVGGLWARLAAYPDPYCGALNLRIDLDAHHPDDYARFRSARRALDDCCTHFISVAAYKAFPEIMAELRDRDAQSHGYYHHIYVDREDNRRNLERASARLRRFGIEARGFCAPMGRWNPGLQEVLEETGFLYSSEFALAHDDVPFFPYLKRAARFSTVLQVPVHPVCLGLFLDTGVTDRAMIESYFRSVVRAKYAVGEPIFLYGHPDGRLGRYPFVLEAIADEASRCPLLWRTTMTEFARWWRARAGVRFAISRYSGLCRVDLLEGGDSYKFGIEVWRGRGFARLALPRSGLEFRPEGLAYEQQTPATELPRPHLIQEPRSLRNRVKHSLDWEKVTPADEIRITSLASLLKKGLRSWQDGQSKDCERKPPTQRRARGHESAKS